MRLVWHSAAFCGTPLTIGFSSASALTSCAWIFSKTDEEEKEDEHVNMGKQSMVCHGANKAHAIGREQVGADVRRCLENTNSVFADRNVSLHPWAFYGNKLCLENISCTSGKFTTDSRHNVMTNAEHSHTRIERIGYILLTRSRYLQSGVFAQKQKGQSKRDRTTVSLINR